MITYKELLTDILELFTSILRSENKFWKFTNPFYYPVMVTLLLFVLIVVPISAFIAKFLVRIKNEYFIRYQVYQKDDKFIQDWIDSFDKSYNEFKRHTDFFTGNTIEHYGKKVPNFYRAYLVMKNIQQERLLSAGKSK